MAGHHCISKHRNNYGITALRHSALYTAKHAILYILHTLGPSLSFFLHGHGLLAFVMHFTTFVTYPTSYTHCAPYQCDTDLGLKFLVEATLYPLLHTFLMMRLQFFLVLIFILYIGSPKNKSAGNSTRRCCSSLILIVFEANY